MPAYKYKAVDGSGGTVTATIEASDLEDAEDMLYSSGLIPLALSPTRGYAARGQKSAAQGHGRVSPPELVMFFKQFRTMYKAGIPLMRLMEIMKNQTESKTLRNITGGMLTDISDGLTLSGAMAKYPSVFSPLYCAMIKAGETSGNVPEVMDRLVYIIGHENKVKSQMKSAMTYPVIVVVSLFAAFVFLLAFVIPKFVAIFAKYDIALPLPTKIAISMYSGLSHYWPYIVLSIVVAAVLTYFYLKTENGKFVRDSLFLSLPIFGPLFVKASMSRFASIFSILHKSGVPILESLTILTETFGNTAISRIFKNAREEIEEGKGIAAPLMSAKHFTPMAVTMISVGEESGNLEEMLRDISSHYDDEVNYTISRLTEIIGPFLIITLAAVVLFFALAVFMPMWDLTKIGHAR